MNRKDLKKLLDLDPIKLADDVTGDREQSDALGFAISFIRGRMIKKEMKDRNDTYYGIPLTDFRRIMIETGFELIYEEEFVAKGYDGEEDRDIQLIYWKDDEALLLSVDSYWNQKSINSGRIYYNWASDILNMNEIYAYGLISSGHFVKTDPPIWSGQYDIREALNYHLENLRTYGHFLSPWVETPYLWLLHYMDSKVNGYSVEEIVKRKLGKVDKRIVNKIITKESEFFTGE